MGRRVQLLAVIAGVAVATAALPAAAADQEIFAVVAPTVGVGVDNAGNVAGGGNTPLQVTREWHGGTLVVTVAPR